MPSAIVIQSLHFHPAYALQRVPTINYPVGPDGEEVGLSIIISDGNRKAGQPRYDIPTPDGNQKAAQQRCDGSPTSRATQ
ncbi:hypothetical protein [uncultured Duncaniella sp.]|uniref:hypothetical protein n=1 Tax=uncultured Duncaniella sp. TaxID=2768039 RepID=UPI0025E9F171|nr:hypothetical protein [uncultured Duncaniella sp.]